MIQSSAIYKVSLFPINVKDIFLDLNEAATRLHDNGQVINFSASFTRLILPSNGLYSGTNAAVELLTGVFAKEVGAETSQLIIFLQNLQILTCF